MTHPPDPALADSIVNWAMFGIGIAGALWRRRKQNEKTVAAIKAASAEEVAALRKIVEDLQASKEADQTRSAIMTEKINHLDGTMSATNTRLDRLELALPKVEDVLQKTLNFFERAKGGSLVEKPIAGSGGLTTIKKKEEKKS
jgi:predicted ATP-grasp superfamily ATP-dependent carboligase